MKEMKMDTKKIYTYSPFLFFLYLKFLHQFCIMEETRGE